VQLLNEVVGTAVGVLIYSFCCAICSLLLIWLVWVHHERDSFVALLSYSTLLSTITSIIQQIHTIIDWRDIRIEQYNNSVSHNRNAQIIVASPAVGLDLILFYIQYYCYNVEGLLTLFWATALTHSIYGFANPPSFKAIRHAVSPVAKVIAVLLPALFIGLLQIKTLQTSLVAFLVVANINMMATMLFGSIILLVILGKYVHTRRQLLSWDVYGASATSQTTAVGSRHTSRSRYRKKSIYDRWLIVRFTVAFAVLAGFQLATIFFEVESIYRNSSEAITKGPDLTVATAKADFLFFLPGVSPSILVFVVFGTTKPFCDTMRYTFIPKRFRR
ncbi:uncharacterized protein BCR38DRAFT_304062, partial [Pseudomassariella vexata]